MNRKKKARTWLLLGAALGLLPAVGCGGNGALKATSQAKISESERNIAVARQSNATQSAQFELKTAEDKLAQAKTALAAEDYEGAHRLAEQASTDADYARAKAVSAKSKKTAEDMAKNIEKLRGEIDRMSR